MPFSATPVQLDTEPYRRIRHALQLIALQEDGDAAIAAQAKAELQRWRTQSLEHEKIARAAQRGWDMTAASNRCPFQSPTLHMAVCRMMMLMATLWLVTT